MNSSFASVKVNCIPVYILILHLCMITLNTYMTPFSWFSVIFTKNWSDLKKKLNTQCFVDWIFFSIFISAFQIYCYNIHHIELSSMYELNFFFTVLFTVAHYLCATVTRVILQIMSVWTTLKMILECLSKKDQGSILKVRKGKQDTME